MQLSPALAVALIAFGTVVQTATVGFYTTRSCAGSASEVFRINCNSCADPPLDWFAAEVTDIDSNQRVSMHNQNGCTPASQVGQWFGPVCGLAGHTAIRSVWVACDGQKRAINGSEPDFAIMKGLA